MDKDVCDKYTENLKLLYIHRERATQKLKTIAEGEEESRGCPKTLGLMNEQAPQTGQYGQSQKQKARKTDQEKKHAKESLFINNERRRGGTQVKSIHVQVRLC